MYALDKILEDGKTLPELTNEKLVELISNDGLTAAMFKAVEDEYIHRLQQVPEDIKQ